MPAISLSDPDRPGAARRVHARFVALAAITAALLIGSRPLAQRPLQPSGPPNFDVRTDGGALSTAYMSRFAAARVPGDSGGPQTAALAQLRADFPTIDVANGPELRTPETIGLPAGLGFLTGPSTDRVGTMRAFMSTYAGVYGLSADQVAGLELVADYTNPAGNMAWVEFEQKINGLPVFRGLIRGGFTAQGELARTTGSLAPGLDPMSLPVSPVLMAEEAVVRAADSVGWSVPNGSLERQAGGVGGEVRFGRGRAGDDVRAWLLYFPLSNGVARLAWATVIWGDPDVYMMLVDAEDGSLLFRKNLTNYQTQPATYVIYNDDSPAPLSPTTVLPGMGTQAPSIARTLFSLIGNEEPNTFNSLGWMTDGLNATEGNNVRAGLDLFAPDGIEATVTGVARVFDFAYNPAPGSPAPGESPTATGYRNGEVTDMFYWTNVYHDRLYLLGFTEAARNFQNDNFGRGGLGGDRVRAEGQDYSGTNNANFSTPPDGTSGRMQMYIFPDTNPARTSGLDHDVVIHELTHGTSNRLHSNGSGLSTTMSGGMGEGWSDFYARAVLSSAGEDPNGIYTTGGWVTYQFGGSYTDNYYYGIRRFPYAVRTTVGSNGLPHNPLTFADIDPSQINLSDGAFPRGPFGSGAAFQVHNIGEVWASALFEVRARFITRLGYGVGHQRILQFVTDGMKLDPANPTLLQGRDSIIAAASAGGGTQADFNDIWAGFAARGMGASAQVLNASTGSVVEAFDVPGITITAQPQSQLISSGQTATLTVTAVGTPPIAYQWYAGVSPNTASPIGGATLASYTTPPLFATASYWVRVSNGLGSVNSNTATVTVMVPGQAAYNPSLKAPMCGLAGNSCDSGPVLINGRDSIPGGNEPNQPNTINNSCGDGGSGTYHVDESIDRLRVFTLDGTPFAAGKLVRIEATVWVFNEFPLTDRLDLYRAPDATNPVWTFVATLTPSAAGAQIMTADYVLPAGSLQAVRGNFRFGGGASPCSQGNFDDHDDLIFAVGTVASPFNKIAPLSGAVDQPAGVTVTWQASSGASGYEVCYDTTNNNSCDTGWRPVGTNTSAFLTEVRGGGTYFWQVRAQSAGPPLEANGGTWWSLTLESIGKLGPAFGAGDLPTSVPLSWQSSAGSATYEYCVDTVNNQRCDSAWVPVGGATGAVVPVGAGGIYFWQVRAVSAGGPVELNEGAWWRFSTSGAFSKVGPGSDTNGHPMDVLLSWQASTGATGYEYCVDLTNNGTCDGAWVSAGTDTNALVIGLTAGATYYWQVRALTAGGPIEANSGVWWHFTRQPLGAPVGESACTGVTNVDALGGLPFITFLDPIPYGCRIVDAAYGRPVHDGSQSVRFELHAQDCNSSPQSPDCQTDRSRYEVFHDNRGSSSDGNVVRYEVWVYVPPQVRFRPRGGNIMFLNQLQYLPPDSEVGGVLAYLEVGEDSELMVRTHQGFTFDVQERYTVLQNPVGVWTKVVWEIGGTTESNGFLHVYVNDLLKVNETKPTLPTAGWRHSLKIGIYNAFKSASTEPYDTQIAYFDSITMSVAPFPASLIRNGDFARRLPQS